MSYEEAFLITTGNSIEADLIESILKSNDIPVLRKYKGPGGYMMVYMGGSVYGVDLFVPKQLLEKATLVLENSREASLDPSFPDNIENNGEIE